MLSDLILIGDDIVMSLS